MRWLAAAGAATILINAVAASAEVTTERGSSILVFPKVIYDPNGQLGEPVSSIIQISNTSNSLVYAHCFYVNSAPLNPDQPVGPFNPPQWQELDFDIVLTKQQPTHWVVGDGRPMVANDPLCSRTVSDCNGAGFDPLRIPPVDLPFVGELKCIEVDATGVPLNGNHLKGQLTLVTPDGEASKYNAVGIVGYNTAANSNDGDPLLCIGGGKRQGCPAGAEYAGCPAEVLLDHFADRASNPVVQELTPAEGSTVHTELTIVPCTQDFENGSPQPFIVQFILINEFEERLSGSTSVTCWANFRLSDVDVVFRQDFVGTRFVQTRMFSPAGGPGFIAVAEEFHTQGTAAGMIPTTSRAALNLIGVGERASGDLVTLQREE